MKATPFSKEPYYPIALSNGQDGVVVNYTGTNFCPVSGHNLYAESLGVSCGWYKASTRAHTGRPVTQVVRACIHAEVFDSACTPSHYEQSMDAKTGILTTKLTFAKEIHVTVESFLTDDGLWGEKLTVDKCPPSFSPRFGFGVLYPNCGYAWLKHRDESVLDMKISCNEISFTYKLGDLSGIGALIPSVPFPSVSQSPDSYYNPDGVGIGMYGDVREGAVYSRIMICIDETECKDIHAEFERRKKIAAEGYEAVKMAHIAANKARKQDTWVSVPDERVQGVYDISRYDIDTNYNRTSGAISLGIFPHLWAGALHCSYDANFIIMALMQSGNREAAEKYKEFFISQGEMGREALQKINMEGTAFSGWTDCFGNFGRKGPDLTSWLTSYKSMFVCCEIINRYFVWKYGDRTLDAKTEAILRDVLLFIENNLLIKTEEGFRLKNVKSGTENGLDVEADTSTVLMLAAALNGASEMLSDPKYTRLANEIKEPLKENYREDGVLMPYKDATHTAGGQMDYYIYSMPDAIGIESVDAALKEGKTPWGYTFDQTSEEKRHWPWIHSRAAICYAHEGRSEDAMEHILDIPNYSSALGALPEYIRMDGLPANYWYTTSHGLAVWAIHDAFAHVKRDTVRILWGMTDKWQDFSCENLHLENRLTVSLSVRGGKLEKMELHNPTKADITVNLFANPTFAPEGLPANCTVKANESFIYTL